MQRSSHRASDPKHHFASNDGARLAAPCVGTSARQRAQRCARRFETVSAALIPSAGASTKRSTDRCRNATQAFLAMMRARRAPERKRCRPPARRPRAQAQSVAGRALVVIGRPDHHFLRLCNIADLGRGLGGALEAGARAHGGDGHLGGAESYGRHRVKCNLSVAATKRYTDGITGDSGWPAAAAVAS